MSTPNTNDAPQANPQQPAPQPQTQQPMYAPPQYAPPQPQYQAQAQQPQQWQPAGPAAPAARSDFNVPGLIASIILVALLVVWSFASPFVIRHLSLVGTTTFNGFYYTLVQWLNVIVTTPLCLVALILGIIGARSRTRPRGRVLAYLAIGAAGAEIIATIVSVVATRAAYGLLLF